MRALGTKKQPVAAMHQACMLSSALAVAVLPVRPNKVDEEIEHSEAGGPFTNAGAQAASSSGIGRPSVLVASSLPLAILVLMLDTKRQMLKNEAKWFTKP
jgi:hypothetical protein